MLKVLVALLSVLLSLTATSVSAQEKIDIPLRLNLEIQQFSGQVIASRLNDANSHQIAIEVNLW